MRYSCILVVAFFLLSISLVSAQSEVLVIQEFVPGKKYSYEIKRSKEDSRKPITKGLYSITSVTAEVSKGKKNLRLIKFIYGESRIEGMGMSSRSMQEYKEQEMYNGIEITLIVDEEGRFRGLASYDDAKSQIEGAMNKLLHSKNVSIDDADIKKIQEQLRVTYDTGEKLISSYFPELSLYFGVFGNHYVKGAIQEYEYETTNPFGGEPFPMKSKVSFNSVEHSVATISGNDTIEPEDLKRVLIDTFKKIAASGGQPFNESQIPDFSMETKTEIKYDLLQKKLLAVSALRNIKASGIEQKQLTQMTLLDIK